MGAHEPCGRLTALFGTNFSACAVRHDWNSLLDGQDKVNLFGNWSKEYWPPADAIVDYINAFAAPQVESGNMQYGQTVKLVEPCAGEDGRGRCCHHTSLALLYTENPYWWQSMAVENDHTARPSGEDDGEDPACHYMISVSPTPLCSGGRQGHCAAPPGVRLVIF
jgi:hypothetical protein